LSVDEHTIQLAGSPAFYRTAPYRGAPTLYVHGVPTSSDDWIPFLERTGGIAPDLLGFGRSGKGGNLDFSIGGLADFLQRLLADLGIGRVKLVVHDWGGPVGLAFAQRDPARVERIVICNAVPMFEVEGVRWHLIGRLWPRPGIGELAMGATSRRMLARTLRRGIVHPDALTDARVAAIWDHFDQGTQRAILRLSRSADEPTLVAAGARLGALGAPALVVWGARDPWLPVHAGGRYAEALGNAKLDRVQDAGHWPWLDQPGVIDRVAAFVDAAGEAA
jgi:pimeloyl-ACP methyl ester carboxylesterase